MLTDLTLPLRAVTDTAAAHGVVADRCEILQNGSTLVVRLTDSLVARVVVDRNGPRQGGEWFARENAVALHLARHGAPVIPLHPDLPPGPHECLGYTLNFWKFVCATGLPPDPAKAGDALYQCHAVLRTFPGTLPRLAILTESLSLLDTPAVCQGLPAGAPSLLRRHLTASLEALSDCPHQPLHGDAHPGNLLDTSTGLLWTDWEDAFSGPVEWDVASLLWNARYLEGDHAAAGRMQQAYEDAGHRLDPRILTQCSLARAAVMSAWYPVLYPVPGASRQAKLRHRLAWLAARPVLAEG